MTEDRFACHNCKKDYILKKKDDSRPSSSKQDPVISYTITLKNSVIKGYHAFEIRPPMTTPPCPLTVEPEYTNIQDNCACLVWIPDLEYFSQDQLGMTTDEKRHFKLEDVAGLPLGHVPRSLAPQFRIILDKGGKVHAEVTGEPTPSYPPWPAPHEEGVV
ncbi:hypothetical protein KUTeg_007638 [Tegillarca granosa]|uniref:Uncharacterized protein n=1 Tax=Tegillarca granosa TaxID=220873 RepID=A0ABQ9FDS9_TEGGR|nr:hypothetical protein KUTeg_007638 [Tegillarca granosa]